MEDGRGGCEELDERHPSGPNPRGPPPAAAAAVGADGEIPGDAREGRAAGGGGMEGKMQGRVGPGKAVKLEREVERVLCLISSSELN